MADAGTSLLLTLAILVAVVFPLVGFLFNLLIATPYHFVRCRRGRHDWLRHASSRHGVYDYCRHCMVRRDDASGSQQDNTSA